jgi:hypothetical protein
MHGAVGGCARKGSCCLGWAGRGWRPKNCHWRRLLAQLLNTGETRVGALALLSVTQWRTVPGPLEPHSCQVSAQP